MEMGTKPTRKEKNKVSQLKKLADIAKEKKNVGLIIVVLSLLYLLLTTYVWYSEKNILFHDKFKSLDLTLTEPAKVIKQKYGQKIVFKAIEYPKVEYYISGYTLDATDIVAIKSNLNKGSLVKLSVELEHFVSLKKNPSQTKTLSIYGLKDDKTEYLTLESIRAAFDLHWNQNWLLFSVLFGLGFIYGLKLYFQNRNF